jgi:uncharacterized membrane protein YhaH (DUF805 family)
MKWMLLPLRRYAEFDGRSRRMEFWMFNLFVYIIAIGVMVVFGLTYAMGLSETEMMTIMTPVFILYGLFCLAILVPGLAVTVRRLHDIDRSGWAILFGLIPLVGGIILLVFYCTPGTAGPNRFGPDPIQGDQSAHIFS